MLQLDRESTILIGKGAGWSYTGDHCFIQKNTAKPLNSRVVLLYFAEMINNALP